MSERRLIAVAALFAVVLRGRCSGSHGIGSAGYVVLSAQLGSQ